MSRVNLTDIIIRQLAKVNRPLSPANKETIGITVAFKYVNYLLTIEKKDKKIEPNVNTATGAVMIVKTRVFELCDRKYGNLARLASAMGI